MKKLFYAVRSYLIVAALFFFTWTVVSSLSQGPSPCIGVKRPAVVASDTRIYYDVTLCPTDQLLSAALAPIPIADASQVCLGNDKCMWSTYGNCSCLEYKKDRTEYPFLGVPYGDFSFYVKDKGGKITWLSPDGYNTVRVGLNRHENGATTFVLPKQ